MIALICNSINIYLVLLLQVLSKEAQERAEWQKGNKKGEEKGYTSPPPLRKEEIGKVNTLPEKIRKGVLTKNKYFCMIAVKKN